ncbi:MAG: transposase [Planctomycetia bacterium]|nr:transposase [Planctomycetia bacterium]
MHSSPLAYFITFTTYGTWLHGRDPGSVDREHNMFDTPLLPPDEEREQIERGQLAEPPYLLDERQREIVLQTICEVAQHRSWVLKAVHVRSNHVHIVVWAEERPEKVMVDFKAYASRRLKERLGESAERKRWTQHGSTRYLWNEEHVAAAVEYTVNEQGIPMAVYDGRVQSEIGVGSQSEPEA